MTEALVREEAAALFFRDQLITALGAPEGLEVGQFTESYLVHLLAAFARGEALPRREPGFDETPLALMYARALQASRFERAVLLRATADTALFVSGFFAASLPGGDGDVRYYASLGGRAYAGLGREHGPGPVGHPGLPRAGRAFPRVRGRARGDLREDPPEVAAVGGAPLRAMGRDGQPARGRAPRGQGITPVARAGARGIEHRGAHARVGEVAVHVQRRLEALYDLRPEAPVTEYLVP